MTQADAAISVEGLGKRYRLLENGPTTLREAVAAPFRRGGMAGGDFWALRDVSFTISEGEILGIVGNNGAGKSTLLKILSRIAPPTTGSVRLRGRVGSLLEVGTGFHPELSGRDNIFMNGVLLGMSHREIRRRFDEIVEFAEVEKFINLPVKRYSSGMYLRLAFAVAAHLEADILLVDEVLAVGDAAFQKKCLARMGEVARTGRTILFVSHNLTAVQAMCPRSIWIDGGRLVASGETRDVLSRYLRVSSGFGSSTDREWPVGKGPASGGIELRRAAVYRAGGRPDDPIDLKTSFRAEFTFAANASNARTQLALQLVNEHGILVFNVGPGLEPTVWADGLHSVQCEIPSDLLNDGAYRLGATLYQDGKPELELPELLAFNILDNDPRRRGWYGRWPGVIRPKFTWDHSIRQV